MRQRGPQVGRVHRRNHDGRGLQSLGRREDRLRRRVLAEVGDPPAVAAQRERERDQAQVVQLA